MSAMQDIGVFLGDKLRAQFGGICVADIAARDALPAECRTESMAVHVLNNGDGAPEFYVLGAGLTNIDWVAVTDGYALGGSPEAITLEPEVLPSYPGQWSVGANLPAGSYNGAMTGSVTQALMVGGQDYGRTSRSWNGVTWNELSLLIEQSDGSNASAAGASVVGTDASGLVWGGFNYNTARYDTCQFLTSGVYSIGPSTAFHVIIGGAAGIGTPTNAMSLGGYTAVFADNAHSQSFNGSVWSVSVNLPYASKYNRASGPINNSIMIGAAGTNAHEEAHRFNGTTFVALADMPVARKFGALGGNASAATYTCGQPTTDETVLFDGVTWSQGNPAPATNSYPAGAGNSQSVILTWGFTPTDPIDAPSGMLLATWIFNP